MAQSPVDSAAIPVPDLDAAMLSLDASFLAADARSVRTAGADVVSSWSGLAAVYTAPESAQLFSVMDLVGSTTDGFAADVESVAATLQSFAAEAGPLAAQLAAARSQAAAFASRVSGDDDWDHDSDLVAQNNAIVHSVNTAVCAYQAAERRAANAIEALIGGHTWHVSDPHGSGQDPYAYGYASIPDNAATPWGAAVKKKDGCVKSTLTGVGHFFVGVGDAAWGMVKGVGLLVWDGVGLGGWDKFKQTWEGLGFLGTLLAGPVGWAEGMAIWGPSGYTKRLEAMGKGLLDWDEWKTDPAKAAGEVVFNVVTLAVPVGGEAAAIADGARGARLAADAGKAAEAAGDAGKASKLADTTNVLKNGLRTAGTYTDPFRYIGKLPKVSDLANGLKVKFGDLTGLGKNADLDHTMTGWTHDGAHAGAHAPEPAHAGAAATHDGASAAHGGTTVDHGPSHGGTADTGGGTHGGGHGDASGAGSGPDGHGDAPAGPAGHHGDHAGSSDKPWDKQSPAEQMATAQSEVDSGAKTFANDADAAEYGGREWNDYTGQLPADVKQSIFDYTADPPHEPNYTDINGYLRHGGEGSPPVLEDIAKIDQAMAGHPTPEAVVVTRGTGVGHLVNQIGSEDLTKLAGTVLPDSAYTSASLGGPAEAFKHAAAVIHARVPADTPALWVENVGAYGGGERELLLARGLELHVDRVTIDDHGQWQLYGHYVSPK